MSSTEFQILNNCDTSLYFAISKKPGFSFKGLQWVDGASLVATSAILNVDAEITDTRLENLSHNLIYGLTEHNPPFADLLRTFDAAI